jgi:hypothetical protein
MEPEETIHLALSLAGRPLGIVVPGRAVTLNLAFTGLARLKDFMDALHRRKVVRFTRYKALPTTRSEYFGRLRARTGGFDLAVDPDPSAVADGRAALSLAGEFS